MEHPIVLVNGLFGNLSDKKILSAITDHNIYAPDLIGYGDYRTAPTDKLTLDDQADHIANWVTENCGGPVNLIGHSIGGAISVLFAAKYPALTASITSAEGNFILEDAFWTAGIAKQDISATDLMLQEFKDDTTAWLARSGVEPTKWCLSIAEKWLDHQPASTLRAQARAVIETTSDPAYLEKVKALLASDTPFNLIAGERSREAWHVPGWVVDQANSNFDISAAGHFMMLDAPEVFGRVVRAVCL
ncbi:MAG: alpha/beta hydrolase [Kordiimonadaceae bacterium]|nr:alpha/beta hydrolase [Kordiimonadaceae bacterium]